MKKIYTILLLTLLSVSLAMPLLNNQPFKVYATASEVIIREQTAAVSGADPLYTQHPSSSDLVSALSQSFRSTDGDYNVTKIALYCYKVGSPTENYTAHIYANDTTGFPTGSALATSVPVNGSSISGVAWYNWTFSTPFVLLNSSWYAFDIECNTNGVVTSMVTFYKNNTVIEGKEGYYHNSAWKSSDYDDWVYDNDMTFKIYGAPVNPMTLAAYLEYFTYGFDWTHSMDTMFAGYIFNEVTLAQLTQLLGQLYQNGTGEADLDIGAYYAWQPALWWSVQMAKYGVENQTLIKWILENATIMSNGLPLENATGWRVTGRYELWGYYYAKKFSYEESKWNMTRAYQTLLTASSNGTVPFYDYSSSNVTGYGNNRFYDEYMQTADCFVQFYMMGINDSLALNHASFLYGFDISEHWSNSAWGWFFTYRGFVYPLNLFETSQGMHLLLVEKLAAYNSTLAHVDYITTTIETCFLSDEWDSPMWLNTGGFAVTHANKIDGTTYTDQKRLKDTMTAWLAMYAMFMNMTAPNAANMQRMLNGSSVTPNQPAWKLLMNSTLYDSATQRFRLFTTEAFGTMEQESLTCAVLLMLYLGIVPINTTRAQPINEYYAEDICGMADHDILNINLTQHTLTVSTYSNGSMQFIYGSTPVTYNFPYQGVYTLHFASDWNSIVSVTFDSGLPSGRVYLLQSLYPLQTFHVQDAVTFVPLNAVNCSIKGFTGTMYSNLTDGTGSCTITLAAPDMVYQYWSVAKVGYQSQLSYTQLPDLINMTLAVVHDVTFIHSLDGTFLASGSVKANNTVTTYDHNEVITLSCVPAALYHFVNFSWDTGSSVVNNTAFTVTQNFTIWCYFSNQLVVALSSVPEIAANYSETTYSLTGSTPSTIEIAAGAVNFTVLTITYAPNSSYLWTFDYWLVNSTDIYDTYSILFTISGDTSLAIVYSGSGVPPSFEFLYPHDAILQTLYFRSDTWTILDQLGYKLQTVNTNTPASDSRYDADTKDVTYGFRVYYIDYLNNTGELTVSEPEALMVKTTNTSSMMTAYWNCPATTALVSAIEIRVYQKFNDEEWSLRVILISKSDLLWKLPAATWTFNLFMSRVEGSTNSTMWFGSSTYASSVALQYFRADPWEAAMARLYQLDLFGFMMMPWMYWLPDLFYGLVMLFIVVTSIIYHNTVKVILAEFWIFGGAGSILWAMIPPLGLHLAVIFLAVAMGWSLMRLFYGKRY